MKHKKSRVIFAIVATIFLIIVFISACNFIGIGGSGDSSGRGPADTGIITPAENTQVVVGGPVQVQSAFDNSVTRAVLLVQAPGQEGETLIRADIPDQNGVVLQQWIPGQVGISTVKVMPYVDDTPQKAYVKQVEVIENVAVSVASVQPEQAPSQPSDQSTGFQAPTATPIPPVIEPEPTEVIAPDASGDAPALPPSPPAEASGGSDASITVKPATSLVMDGDDPAEALHYPPPPPAPGVPPGPTQDQLPEMRPPVADGADILGVFTSDNTQRVLIPTDDDVPAKVVGGSTVFRAWRVQNTGTATWGPGYELSFYGGRAMGSGGVAFEQTFPGEPARRNTIIDNNRLVVPEGMPNQTAVVEVMLKTPVTPGIHQSYWRMRNPHGVYFGPIMGVTMEVIRECRFGTTDDPIYGAPIINKFEILGVGDVYQPEDPVTVFAEFGDNVTLDWNIINAEKFDIVVQKPTGETETTSTSDQVGRITFPVNQLGDYWVTLYADNGSCTVSAAVHITVIPPEDEQFRLIIIHGGAAETSSNTADLTYQSNPTISAGDIQAEWSHFDDSANEFTLFSTVYEQKQNVKNCPVGDTVCYETSGDWERIYTRGTPVGSNPEDAVIVSNLRSVLSSYMVDQNAEYQVLYVLEAKKDGKLDKTVTPCSNTVPGDSGPGFPTEIVPSSASSSTASSPCVVQTDIVNPEPSSCSDGIIVFDTCYKWRDIIIVGAGLIIFIWILRLIFK